MALTEVHERLLDIKQVAEFLGVSPSHVRRLCAAGRFPHPVRVGTLVRWTPSSVHTWLSAQQERAEVHRYG